MFETVLDHWLVLGPWVLGAAVMASALGLPIPSTPLLLAAGAISRQGNLGWAVFALAWLGVVAGDCGSYLLGRCVGRWMPRRRMSVWLQARARFQRDGATLLLLTRFLLTGLDVPTDWVAGSSRYPFRRFLAVGLAGRFIWVLLYGGLGYLAGAQWQQLGQLISHGGSGVGLTLALAGGAYLIIRWLRGGRTAPSLVLES